MCPRQGDWLSASFLGPFAFYCDGLQANLLYKNIFRLKPSIMFKSTFLILWFFQKIVPAARNITPAFKKRRKKRVSFIQMGTEIRNPNS